MINTTMDNLDENNLDPNLTNDNSLSNDAKENLHKSAGWVKVVAILSIAGAALGGLAALFILFTVPVVGVLTIVIYGVGVFIGTLLLKVANSIDRGTFDMDKFALNFYKYWKTAVVFGIIAVVLSFIAGIFAGTASTGMFPSEF